MKGESFGLKAEVVEAYRKWCASRRLDMGRRLELLMLKDMSAFQEDAGP